LAIRNFGPFRNYKIDFPADDDVCVLLTGKNNEGKSTIINALKLVHAGARVVGKGRQSILIDGDEYFKLLQQDTEDLLIGRLIYNYAEQTAAIHARFSGNLEIVIRIDPVERIIYAENRGMIPPDVERMLGFIPPLGPLSESEEILVKESYLRANLNSSLAPRHLRNHLLKLLTREEFELVRQIIKSSWDDIELLDYEAKYSENRINCYYREQRTDREICWAGQGLQVWFQIITHLVRLRNSSVLVFDEPEINLHPEKQNDLLAIIREHFHGSVIIATHSVELMNNVSVSHILNIQKRTSGPKIKSTDDRAYLELVRSQIGSNFNLIASQFDDCDLIIFTEDVFDFSILRELAEAFDIQVKAFNIPLHGFSEYKKAASYKDAYKILIGKAVRYAVLLDRDFYPQGYLDSVREEMKERGIEVFFTIGKEIENLFFSAGMAKRIVPKQLWGKFSKELDRFFEAERLESVGSFLTLHKQFLPARTDVKTIAKVHMAEFEKQWKDPDARYRLVSGKRGLSKLRDFIKKECGTDLSNKLLTEHLVALGDNKVRRLIRDVYQA
jgi:predicted ATPase